MNTSTFLTTLRVHAGLPLVFKAGSDVVSPGYHLTEVKEVAFRSMDCGAMTHRWTETHFEVWVPPTYVETAGRGHMAADKFLRIVDRVQQELPLDGDAEAKVYAALGGHPAAVHAIESIVKDGQQLVVSLSADRARCKARERRLGAACGCGDKAGAEKPAAVACCG